MATHSSIFTWKILWKEEPGGLQSIGLQESEVTEHTHNQVNTRFLNVRRYVDVYKML